MCLFSVAVVELLSLLYLFSYYLAEVRHTVSTFSYSREIPHRDARQVFY